ncbi:MAG: hydrogenase nickel incorporation protein HypA [Candidatus Aenigmarchaeota archaeon]|nr:hydrogenase nickel incorporation protein HypA [Candidatus Aenigmarchaeota archaeon]
MHEWALAESVIISVSRFAKKKKMKKVKTAEVSFGEMQNIDKKIFNFAVKELTKEMSVFSNFSIKMKTEKTKMKCRSCSKEWQFSFSKRMKENDLEAIHFVPEVSHVYVKCPKCGSRDFKILNGRGIMIKSVIGK